MNKQEAGELANLQRIAKGMSWQQLADSLGRDPVWATAAILGFHPIPATDAQAIADKLELSDEVAAAFQRQPYRIADEAVTSDPTIYRFYELLQVYGPAIKELIHEEFGDGIMSAINCNVKLARVTNPDGDRVQLIVEGKFLSYQW